MIVVMSSGLLSIGICGYLKSRSIFNQLLSLLVSILGVLVLILLYFPKDAAFLFSIGLITVFFMYALIIVISIFSYGEKSKQTSLEMED